MKTAFVYGPYLWLLVTFAAFALRCRFGTRAQAIWAMVLLACFSKFFCYRELGGDAFTPGLPEHVIWVWNWAYSGAFILGLLAVLTVFFRFPKRAFVLPVLAWGLAAWGVWNGVAVPSVKEVEIAYADLPESLDGYRIVHLSDLHVSSAARKWWTEKIVEAANACGGDIIVITGDIVDGYPHERRRDVMPLKDLRAKDGVYAVTGNHEAYFDIAGWMPWFEHWGIRFLANDCVFPRKGLALGGVDERALPQLHPGEDHKSICPSVVEAFAKATNGEFRVFLQHRPSHAAENALIHNVRLQLSGHTHGGVFPGLSWLVAKHNRGLVRGLYAFQPPDFKPLPLADLAKEKKTSFLYLSAGAGQWAGFPLRFFNPTEITVIVLKRNEIRRR